MLRVAIAQIAPVLLDRAATLAKVVARVEEAGRQSCGLVAFGETLVPAYPVWLCRTDGARFDDANQKQLHALYLDQAVCLEDGHLADVAETARSHGITVVLGIAERPRGRGGHTLFCTRVIIDGGGQVVSTHRKLMPTYEERLAWGIGDGAGLTTHRVGPFTLGSLNCWENWMPLARTALYQAGEDLHVAIWPGCVRLTQEITRFIALESRSYVLSACGVIRAADIPDTVPLRDVIVANEDVLYDGGSCIAGPDGNWLVQPCAGTEQLITADLDPTRIRAERQNFDPAGHYARPDVLRLTVNRDRHDETDGRH